MYTMDSIHTMDEIPTTDGIRTANQLLYRLAALLVLSAVLVSSACREPDAPASTGTDGDLRAAQPDTVETQTGTWTQVWGDEFDTPDLDTTKWTHETGGHGWGNQELQYYTDRPENSRVEDGRLVIEARREAYEGREYTSARLNSTETWANGRFEIRAKLPPGRGTWPALWMLAEEESYGDAYWPDNGEIDIMEHVGYNPGVVYAYVHTDAYNHIDNTQRGDSISVPTAVDDFHVYALEWTRKEIRAYVNDTHYFTFPNERRTSDAANYRQWPFDRPFFLLMNIAVGGTWGGRRGVDADVFPRQMEIDYVRVYQRNGDSES